MSSFASEKIPKNKERNEIIVLILYEVWGDEAHVSFYFIGCFFGVLISNSGLYQDFLTESFDTEKKNDEKIRERIEEDRSIQSQAYKQRFVHHMPQFKDNIKRSSTDKIVFINTRICIYFYLLTFDFTIPSSCFALDSFSVQEHNLYGHGNYIKSRSNWYRFTYIRIFINTNN